MLSPTTSVTFGRNDLHVFFSYDPTTVLGFFAKLAIARDPYGPVPLDSLRIGAIARVRFDLDAISSTFGLLADRELLGGFGSPGDRMKSLDASTLRLSTSVAGPGVTLSDLFRLAQWLGTGAALHLPQVHYTRPGVKAGPMPTSMSEKDPASPPMANALNIRDALDALSNLDTGQLGASWLGASHVEALAALTLQVAFHKIVADTMFTGPITVDSGQSRELLPLVTRVTHLVTLLSVLRDGIALCPMRELARLIVSPPFLPLLEYVQPGLKEEALTFAKQISAIPVHPWLAQAERLGIPATRQTPWGTGNTTQGLATGVRTRDAAPTGVPTTAAALPTPQPHPEDIGFATQAGAWSAAITNFIGVEHGGDAPADGPSAGGGFRGAITGQDGILVRFVKAARPILLRRAMLPPSAVSRVETLLGYTQPSAPPVISLHGDTWQHIVMTGAGMSEAATDWVQLASRPRFSRQPANGVPIVSGDPDTYLYNAKVWRTGSNGSSGLATRTILRKDDDLPPLYVSPEIPAYTEGYGLQRTPPEAIRPYTNGEFFGDVDATTFPYTIEAVASILGYADIPAAVNAGALLVGRLAHLFHVDSAGLWEKKLKGVTRLFISERTQQPWRRPVPIPSIVPYEQVAMDERAAPQRTAPVESFVSRTPGYPECKTDSLSIADSMAIAALRMLGADVK